MVCGNLVPTNNSDKKNDRILTRDRRDMKPPPCRLRYLTSMTGSFQVLESFYFYKLWFHISDFYVNNNGKIIFKQLGHTKLLSWQLNRGVSEVRFVWPQNWGPRNCSELQILHICNVDIPPPPPIHFHVLRVLYPFLCWSYARSPKWRVMRQVTRDNYLGGRCLIIACYCMSSKLVSHTKI